MDLCPVYLGSLKRLCKLGRKVLMFIRLCFYVAPPLPMAPVLGGACLRVRIPCQLFELPCICALRAQVCWMTEQNPS
jgi:hypothetical protein